MKYVQIDIIVVTMFKQARKPIKWVSSAKRDLNAMPEDIKDVFGHAIDLAQAGGNQGQGAQAALEAIDSFLHKTL